MADIVNEVGNTIPNFALDKNRLSQPVILMDVVTQFIGSYLKPSEPRNLNGFLSVVVESALL